MHFVHSRLLFVAVTTGSATSTSGGPSQINAIGINLPGVVATVAGVVAGGLAVLLL